MRLAVRTILPACTLLAALAAHPALAQDANLAGARLAATCAGCHGTNGVATGNVMATLSGRRSEELVATMQAFRDGSRPATIMHQLAKGYSDEQVRLLASWFAAQAK